MTRKPFPSHSNAANKNAWVVRPSARRIIGLALSGIALVLTTACSNAAGSAPEQPASTPAATPESGPWDDYGLPAPGSEGTDTTTSVAEIRFINQGLLDNLKPADRKILIASMETLFEQAYWKLEHFPDGGEQVVGQFDEYMAPDIADTFNKQVRKDGSSSFGAYTGERTGNYYQYKVDSIDIEVLEAYVPTDKAYGPYAKFRVTSTSSWTSLPWSSDVPKKQMKPKHYEMTTKVEAWFSNIDDDEFTEMGGWQSDTFDVETTPAEKTA